MSPRFKTAKALSRALLITAFALLNVIIFHPFLVAEILLVVSMTVGIALSVRERWHALVETPETAGER